MDGDLAIYLIPSRIIAGRVGILLHTYTKYIVGSAAGLDGARRRLNGLRRTFAIGRPGMWWGGRLVLTVRYAS